MQQFKIRASAAGKIMTNGRGGKIMGQTAKSYCEQWVLENLIEIPSADIASIQIDKGNAVEKDALDFIGIQRYDGGVLDS